MVEMQVCSKLDMPRPLGSGRQYARPSAAVLLPKMGSTIVMLLKNERPIWYLAFRFRKKKLLYTLLKPALFCKKTEVNQLDQEMAIDSHMFRALSTRLKPFKSS